MVVTYLGFPPGFSIYDYRCFKGCPSFVLFAVIDAHRHFTYCDYGLSGVMGDSKYLNLGIQLTN